MKLPQGMESARSACPDVSASSLHQNPLKPPRHCDSGAMVMPSLLMLAIVLGRANRWRSLNFPKVGDAGLASIAKTLVSFAHVAPHIVHKYPVSRSKLNPLTTVSAVVIVAIRWNPPVR